MKNVVHVVLAASVLRVVVRRVVAGLASLMLLQQHQLKENNYVATVTQEIPQRAERP
jgi:hypothetical protein